MDRSRVTRSEFGRLVGVSSQTASKYARLPGFPDPDQNDKIEAFAAICWWVVHKAPRPIQRELHSQLGVALGIATEVPEDRPLSIAEETERLDLQLKAHKVLRAVGEAVLFSDIRGIVGRLASAIREACQQVNAASGRDVLPLFEAAFDQFEEELKDAQQEAGEAAT